MEKGNKAIPENIEIPMIIGDDNNIQEAEVFFRDQDKKLFTYTINSSKEFIRSFLKINDFNNLTDLVEIENENPAQARTFVWNDKLNLETIRKITAEIDLITFSKFLTRINEEVDTE